MSTFRRFEIVDHSPSCFTRETSIVNQFKHVMLYPDFLPSSHYVEDGFDHVLDVLTYPPILSDEFEAFTDLIRTEEIPFHAPTRRVIRRVGLGLGTELYLQSLGDRVSDLEFGFDRLGREKRGKKNTGERKYTWTAEIKCPEKIGVDRKYKLTAEKKGLENNYKWTAEIKGKGGGGCLPFERTYTAKVCNGGGSSESRKKCEKVKGKGKSVGSAARIAEIEDHHDHGPLVLRQVFARRLEKSKGKRRVLSPLDAATQIQISFRAYLIRRSQALRGLRELAIAKTKLKEIRSLFNNFSYHRRLTRDAEERQRFSEKIIVLLLTVDAIEGADIMVRAVKKAMVNELEAMLDVVDPQPHGKSLSFRRRTFDMPESSINKELAAGVAQVVQMLDQETNNSETFEAYL
ncbi:uncharacterized protein [Primulina eburnea]|uniref:uncharacterized protein n=1 Tax=Primulina eburnea TaxID=1245227 RepID=UPI003C6C8664